MANNFFQKQSIQARLTLKDSLHSVTKMRMTEMAKRMKMSSRGPQKVLRQRRTPLKILNQKMDQLFLMLFRGRSLHQRIIRTALKGRTQKKKLTMTTAMTTMTKTMTTTTTTTAMRSTIVLVLILLENFWILRFPFLLVNSQPQKRKMTKAKSPLMVMMGIPKVVRSSRMQRAAILGDITLSLQRM